MAEIFFEGVSVRNVGSDTPVVFTWPSEGATFTYQVSLDNGLTFVPGLETITENPPDGDDGDYQIPVNDNERPNGTGLVIYRLNDGTDEGKLYLNVIENPNLDGPDPPSPNGMYTSVTEIERVFSSAAVINHTEDETINSNIMNEIIARATAFVDVRLRGRFAAEDLNQDTYIRMHATYIACYFLSLRRGNPSLFSDSFGLAASELEQIRDGTLSIDSPTTVRPLLQTPMLDSRYFSPARLNQDRSSQVYSGQKVRYIPYHYC